MAYPRGISFDFKLEDYILDDEQDEIQVIYHVEGAYHPAIKGSFSKYGAASDIDYYGASEWFEYDLKKVDNLTDNRLIKDSWLHNVDIYEQIAHRFHKENPHFRAEEDYFEEDY